MKKTDAQKFIEYLNSIPKGEYTEFLNRIESTCGIRRQTIFNWRRGACSIPQDCKKKIEKLAGQKIWSE